MIPYIMNKARRSLRIPAMSGGVNKRDGISLIQDNQLTDVKNMWYKDGLLKTRPSLHLFANAEQRLLDLDGAEVLDVKVFDEIRMTANSQYLGDSLCTYLVIKYKYDGKYRLQPWIFFFVDTNLKVDYDFSYDEDVSFFAYAFGKDIYMFVSGESVKEIYKITTDGSVNKLSDKDMYAPLVLTNGFPLGNDANSTSGGDLVYGYNLLTRYYKAEYSTVDPNDDTLGMIFTLPVMFGDDNGAGCTVKAEWTRDDGKTYTYEVVLNEYGRGEMETVDEATGLKIRVDNGSVEFLDEEDYTASDSTFIKNNLVITAPGPYDEKQKNKVFDMTTAVWFGGNAYGIHGGSRLFLGGNKNSDEQSLIVWSDLNNPLYFSENNYTYVGNKAQGVVAFGRQDSSLVILKEHEMYSTAYYQNDVTGEDLTNYNVIDLATQTAYFPMTQIHSLIGCDSANSVQVCRNRLVWRYGGKLYSLTNQSQYNERNVFSVSEMVGKINGGSVKSADCFDHYFLFDENKAYVMDYNSYGYNYVASYQKNEDANVKIPWFIWEFPFTPSAVITDTDGLHFIRSVKAGERAVVDMVTMTEDRDTEGYDYFGNVNGDYYTDMIIVPIESYLRTKLFDFGLPSHLKTVNLVNITFGNNHGENINTRFISETDTYDEHTFSLVESEEDMKSPKYLNSKRFFPATKSVVRFGFEVECSGNLSLEAVTLEYRALGGAR